MAQSLKLTIELAGAEEIKRQLEGVGEAGEQAFDKIIDKAKEVGGFKEIDPSFLKQTYDELGTKAPEAIGKITQAVKSATRMETLVNVLTSVENGLIRVQAAASSVDAVLGKALLSSIMKISRFLPAAFAAAVVGAIANTANELLKLDEAAIKAGVSIETMSKLSGIFKAIGASAGEASKGVETFFASIEKAKIDEVTQAVADIKKELATGWFGWEGFKTLERLAQGAGKAAELARQKLLEFGRKIPVDEARESIQKILASTASAEEKFTQLMAAFFKMGDTAKRNALILDTFGDSMGTLIIRGIRAGLTLEELRRLLDQIPPASERATAAAFKLSLAWQRFKNFIASGFEISPEGLENVALAIDKVIAGMRMVGAAMTSAFGGDILSNTIREFQNIGFVLTMIANGAVAVWNAISTGAQAAWQAVVTAAQTAVQTVLQFFAQMPGQIAGFFAGFGAGLWDGIVSSARSAWDQIVGFIQKAIDKVKELAGMRGGQAAGAGAAAHGGIIGGRGTGTSDSNLAWLSRGEHVMPAYAVRQPGVLQLLEALRRSGGNLRGVLDRMGHFALGGMVSAPAFARGGAVGGMSNVTIQFPGVQPITGLRASSAVVDELRRSAALAQVRSGGRKPSRYT